MANPKNPPKRKPPKTGEGVEYKNKSGSFTLLKGKLFDKNLVLVSAGVVSKSGGPLRRVKPSKKEA